MKAAWIEDGRVALRNVAAPVHGAGEALVRNLLAAQTMAERSSLNLTKIAFMPEISGLPTQLSCWCC